MPLVREAECEAAVAVYLNRLSDYLFVAARFAARRIGEAALNRATRELSVEAAMCYWAVLLAEVGALQRRGGFRF